MKYIIDTKSIPLADHWAVLVDQWETVYPDTEDKINVNHLNYIAFDSQEEMMVWLEEQEIINPRKTYRMIFVKSAVITKVLNFVIN